MKSDKILYIPSVDSSNRYLAQLAAERQMSSGSMVQTGYQTSGKGTAGNSWISEPDTNLLCSYLYLPASLEPVNQFYISKCAALACIDLIANTGIECTIKWPNDIYYKNQKIGGILIENSMMGNSIQQSIVGIGINLNQKHFDGLPNPISACLITGLEYKPEVMATQLRDNLDTWYALLEHQDLAIIDHDYKEKLFRKNTPAKFKCVNNVFEGTIIGILPSGELELETQEGVKTFWFKEVEFVI